MNRKTRSALCSVLALLWCAGAAAQPVVAAAVTEFKATDANQDGKVSREEHARGARSMFERMDADRDGKVTAAEMDAAQRSIAGGDAARDELSAAEKIKSADQDGDGVLTAAEHAYASRAAFDEMDADRDGALVPAEMAAGHAAMLKK